jgi:formylglycine-generating enzyme required for sulfatase activity
MANKTYRLPTEAEWEYACRGGTTTPFYCGETISTDLANYNGNYTYGQGQKGQYREKTTEVGIFPANPFGLYDMCGNVWEWCEDKWHETYINAPIDGTAWTSLSSELRLLRGGSWVYYPRLCRSAYRLNFSPDYSNNRNGFRLVVSGARTL